MNKVKMDEVDRFLWICICIMFIFLSIRFMYIDLLDGRYLLFLGWCFSLLLWIMSFTVRIWGMFK